MKPLYTTLRIAGAIALAAALVLIAFTFREATIPFFLILLPGALVNLFTRGVHGNWETGAGMLCMIIPSVVFWIPILYMISLAIWPNRSKDGK